MMPSAAVSLVAAILLVAGEWPFKVLDVVMTESIFERACALLHLGDEQRERAAAVHRSYLEAAMALDAKAHEEMLDAGWREIERLEGEWSKDRHRLWMTLTTEEFATIVQDWVATTRHPRFGKLYTECIYQPMLEVIAHLQASGFKTFIVSGGGVEFMRPWTEKVYGIPPEQVVGSAISTKLATRPSGPVLLREPKIDFVDDGPGKPVGIHKFIGRRPILAFGNSDGDFEMLDPDGHVVEFVEYAADRLMTAVVPSCLVGCKAHTFPRGVRQGAGRPRRSSAASTTRC